MTGHTLGWRGEKKRKKCLLQLVTIFHLCPSFLRFPLTSYRFVILVWDGKRDEENRKWQWDGLGSTRKGGSKLPFFLWLIQECDLNQFMCHLKLPASVPLLFFPVSSDTIPNWKISCLYLSLSLLVKFFLANYREMEENLSYESNLELILKWG